MVLSIENCVLKLLIFFFGVVFIILLYILYNYTYWQRRNIFYLKPTIPFGNFKNLLLGKQHLTELSRDLYNKIVSYGQKYSGAYFIHTPVLIPTDPDLIKRILVTDFHYFSHRGIYFSPEHDPLKGNLFGLETEPWKLLRTKLTPTFSSGKIKNMFKIFLECGEELLEATKRLSDKPINIEELSTCYTVDTIGKCAFGLECNALKNPNEKFRQIAEKLLNPPVKNGLTFLLSIISPGIVKYGNLSIVEKEVSKFFLDIVQQNINYRENNKVRRDDFFQLLLDMKKYDEECESKVDLKMTRTLIAPQIYIFFAAGFETSAMTITLCLFELSQNLQIQNRVRNVIKKVLQEDGGQLTYDGIMKMSYLKQCISETLRKYPPLGFLNRYCVKDYKLPDSDIIIEKGTKILISVLGLHHDPKYFENPEKFDPDRFNAENKDKIIPYTYMPFGEGHRNCIGMKFGQMQTSIGIISLLSNYEFTLNSMTKLPLEYRPQSFTIALKRSIYLNVKKIIN